MLRAVAALIINIINIYCVKGYSMKKIWHGNCGFRSKRYNIRKIWGKEKHCGRDWGLPWHDSFISHRKGLWCNPVQRSALGLQGKEWSGQNGSQRKNTGYCRKIRSKVLWLLCSAVNRSWTRQGGLRRSSERRRRNCGSRCFCKAVRKYVWIIKIYISSKTAVAILPFL